MPRLFRKVSHQMSTIRSSGRMSPRSQGSPFLPQSVYDNTSSIFGRDKYTLVSKPLRTKVATGRPAQLGFSPSMSVLKSKNSVAHAGKPEDTLAHMKHLLRERQGSRGVPSHSGSSKKAERLPAI